MPGHAREVPLTLGSAPGNAGSKATAGCKGGARVGRGAGPGGIGGRGRRGGGHGAAGPREGWPQQRHHDRSEGRPEQTWGVRARISGEQCTQNQVRRGWEGGGETGRQPARMSGGEGRRGGGGGQLGAGGRVGRLWPDSGREGGPPSGPKHARPSRAPVWPLFSPRLPTTQSLNPKVPLGGLHFSLGGQLALVDTRL